MRCWLCCPHCKTRELVQNETEFGPCPECGGGPRFAEGDNGEPMLVWSAPSRPSSQHGWSPYDPTSWDVSDDRQ